MLFRFSGILIIFAVCSLYGLMIKNSYLKRIHDIEDFLILLKNLKSEIQYKNCNLIENLTNINRRPIYKDFLTEIIDGLLDGQAISILWEQSCQKNLDGCGLKKSDINTISNFGRELGISDRETQIGHITFYQEVLQNSLNDLKKEKKEKCRLYSSMGVIIGMFIGILLI